jgi:hypothetical protein
MRVDILRVPRPSLIAAVAMSVKRVSPSGAALVSSVTGSTALQSVGPAGHDQAAAFLRAVDLTVEVTVLPPATVVASSISGG